MNVNDNAVCLAIRGVFAFFASRLAPTGGGVLEPDGVPEWIVTDMVDEPCTKRVGDDVSSHGFQIFLSTQGSVEVALLPYRSI